MERPTRAKIESLSAQVVLLRGDNETLRAQLAESERRRVELVEAVRPVVEDWVATRPKVVDSEGYAIILCAEQLDALAALVGEKGK